MINSIKWSHAIALLALASAPLAACGAAPDDGTGLTEGSDSEQVGEAQQALTSCWAVTGWSSPGGPVGSHALLSSATCFTVPTGYVWLQVTMGYSGPPTDTIWLRIPLSDPHMSGMQFSPLLVFAGYSGTTPIINVDLIVGGGGNSIQAVPYPPRQGVPNAGSSVRLRHRNTGECIKTSATNGAQAFNNPCSTDVGQTFVLDSAGSGTFRLRNQQTSQCLYTVSNGAPVYNWSCWADPAMPFTLVATTDGYRLSNVSTSQCVYGNPTNGGAVHTWGCWADPNMEYNVDIISYGPSTPLPDPPSEK